jgi:hypothetical protein
MDAVREMVRRAVTQGEVRHDALLRFPQLFAAPGLVAILWNGLFEKFEPLDVRAIMRAHFDLVFAREGAS